MFHWKTAKKNKVGVILGQNLGQILVQCSEKSKEMGIINKFFLILYMENTF